ncbi:3-beta hydroxysteroid dehydrogenase/isomerase family-domain-containing protein [Emericellopsis atlantica]|uniref:Sterol-4-alpha-carboxylate 3-dehydrogenase ERG26, decarboxylating n=1 Tax=Emericellopsis atlantica TaxID=2614577 RepID=A0A9P7ZNE2_9HYPO|nr:3-beta hydroxysteroid dehydrogenase/isomerase family-domain-containing protein [Emericellopsis atlantica]KAG9255131.1 3-beta hydroxysteroid dehydrogenase/isomerase family-domain-containing protein [Emericellopsis atlantica]
MATSEKKKGDLGRVLVIGGNGFLGHHVVNQALDLWNSTHVSSIDLRCEKFRRPEVTYKECDITDREKLLSVIEELKPDVVIHTASPVASDHTNAKELFQKVNVEGTDSVIEACQKAGVKALVNTSSASVVSDDVKDLLNADERWPVIRGDQQNSYYSETKAAAEEAVLAANRKEPYKLLTCSIRPAGIFGEGDSQTIPGFLAAYKNNKHKVQIGDNKNLFDFTYVGNVSHGLLLAAHALLVTAGASTAPLDYEKVDGEAFFITNDSPVFFWDFARAVWAAAGDTSGTAGTWHLGQGVGSTLGVLSEIFGSITGRTPTFNKKKVTMTCMTRYFNIAKAKRVLRYEPQWTLQEGVTRGVEWFLEQEKAAAVKAQ